MALYAVDGVLYSTHLEKSLTALLQILNNYSSLTGYKPNMRMWEAMVLGVPVCRELKKEFYGNGT